MRFTPLPAIGLCAAALFAGFVARRVSDGRSDPAIAREEASPTKSEAIKAIPGFPTQPSTDTVETLSTLDDDQLYARLALWLVDASEPDIAAFWRHYSKIRGRSWEISDLILLHWTRFDPQRAIAVAAETADEYLAWRAWACHDPQASLAAVIATDPDSVDAVAEGIGRFHPDWLLKHFEEIPEAERETAIICMKDAGGKNPLEILNFLKDQDSGAYASTGNFKALAREDPWGAIDWATQHPIDRDYPFIDKHGALPTVIRTLAEESPDELARIAEQTPSGQAKLVMEAALFAELVGTDPAAALAQAKSATIPRTAAEHYAAIGLGVVHTDLEQALQLAKDLLAACPDALHLTARIEYPEEGRAERLDIPGVSEFMESLMIRQPEQVMEMISALPPTSGNDPFRSFSNQWIEQDFVAYTNWVNEQTSSDIRRSGASLIVNALLKSDHYQEAAEWASSTDPGDTGQLKDVLTDWRKRDPTAPARWLETTRLPSDRKAAIQSLLDRP